MNTTATLKAAFGGQLYNAICNDKNGIAIAQVKLFDYQKTGINYRIKSFLTLDSSKQNIEKLRSIVADAFEKVSYEQLKEIIDGAQR